MGWRSAKIAEKLVDYANTTNVEFIVDPKILFHGWLIDSYLHLRWSSATGECADLFFDNIMTCRLIICFIDDTASYGPSRKNSILINKHALNREPVPLNNNGPPTLFKRLNAIVFQDCVWARFMYLDLSKNLHQKFRLVETGFTDWQLLRYTFFHQKLTKKT